MQHGGEKENMIKWNKFPTYLPYFFLACNRKRIYIYIFCLGLIRTQGTNLLQKYCKITLNSEVIVKNVIDPDDNSNEFPSTNGFRRFNKQSCENIRWKILIRTQGTNLLQKYCKITLNSEVIVKNVIEADDTYIKGTPNGLRPFNNPFTLIAAKTGLTILIILF